MLPSLVHATVSSISTDVSDVLSGDNNVSILDL